MVIYTEKKGEHGMGHIDTEKGLHIWTSRPVFVMSIDIFMVMCFFKSLLIKANKRKIKLHWTPEALNKNGFRLTHNKFHW